ncbi:type II secretion system F family protein [Trinickia mobilis]|uniref:type II secretion system F family protein n=1 Tax=Trinickia mobilis TaxID=2816356 RepID=UPI001A8C1077|nr:type II secretion system F family protein [Trinickia mobilis]
MSEAPLTKPFSLQEIRMASMFMTSLVKTVSLDDSLKEMAKLQRQRAEFWLSANSHVRAGQSLSSFLEKYWPLMFTTPVRIGEQSGKLSSVFEKIANTAELQLEIFSTMRKLVYPVGMIVLGMGVGIFFMLSVIPAMASGSERSRSSSAMKLSLAAHDLVNQHPAILGAVGLGFIAWAFQMLKSPTARSAILAKLDYVPGLGPAIRSLYYGLWSRYIALMQECSIPLQDAIGISQPLLLDYMVPSVEAVRDNARLGFSNAVDLDKVPPGDPRHALPVFLTNAFRMTDNTGSGQIHFEAASTPLVKIGMVQIHRFIDVAQGLSTLIAAAFAVAPMLLYFLQATDLIKNALR